MAYAATRGRHTDVKTGKYSDPHIEFRDPFCLHSSITYTISLNNYITIYSPISKYASKKQNDLKLKKKKYLENVCIYLI